MHKSLSVVNGVLTAPLFILYLGYFKKAVYKLVALIQAETVFCKNQFPLCKNAVCMCDMQSYTNLLGTVLRLLKS